MTEDTHHYHHSDPSSLESVRVEKNSRGFNVEVKAVTVARAIEMLTELQAALPDMSSGKQKGAEE